MEFLPGSNSNLPLRSTERSPAKTTESAENLINQLIPSEAEALYDLRAIPLYFPASYSLVKPYVQGFEPNGLDVMSLKDVRIDNNWQPKRPSTES
jgi:hypothetical protein